MKQINNWSGQTEKTTLEYEIETAPLSEIDESSSTNAKFFCKYDEADKTDYIIAACSGLITGIIDSFWVGDFSLNEAQNWGRSTINKFVIKVAQLCGYEKSDLEGTIKYLEKAAPMASDQLTSDWGGGLQHHFRDFAHHASIGGLFFSILTQFTELSYGTNTQGEFEQLVLPDKTLIGTNFEEKLFYGTVLWFLHLVSDMAGSNSNAGKGTGIPGPILSFAKEVSALPGIRNITVKFKEKRISLSVFLSKVFNGTAFEHTDNKDLTRFDLRTELGIYRFGAKQSVPVIINQCIIRAYFFVRRLCSEISEKNALDFSELKSLDPTHFLPINNKCINRMITISTGVFFAVDASDAIIRAFLNGTNNKTNFLEKLLLRTNFVGIGAFLISIKTDIASNLIRPNPIPAVKPREDNKAPLTLDNTVVDVLVDVDSANLYKYCFYRMLEDLKDEKKQISKAAEVGRGIESPILKLEDNETRLYSLVAKCSHHALVVKTATLMMQLLAFNGIGYCPFNNTEIFDFYSPFYRVENGKKIAYVFTSSTLLQLKLA